MDEQRTKSGMKARVLVEGKFKGQIVEVLERNTSRQTLETSYRLDTTWNGIPYPAWFDKDEIEIIQEEA